MYLKRPFILFSVLALAGCPTRSKDVSSDGGDAGDDADAALPSLQIMSPTTNSYANGNVTVTVQASGSPAPSTLSVYLDQDPTPLKTLSSPFTFTWDTTTASEDTHSLIAKATVSGRNIESPRVTIRIDRTAPTFTTTPAANRLNVALSDPMTLVFSEPLDPMSVTNTGVTLASGGSTLGTTTVLEPDMKTLTISINSRSSLSFPATITETVAATIKDLAGNAVGTKPSWSWSAPLWVTLPTLSGDAPTLVLDPQGNAIVSSLVYTSATTELSVLRYAPGSTWDLSFGSLPVVSGLSLSGVKVAVGTDGTPTVAWAGDHIYAAHWNGVTWDPFSGNPDASVANPSSPPQLSSIVLDSSGGPLIGWNQQFGLDSQGYVATWSSSAWQLVPAGMQAGVGGPRLLINHAGAPVAMFPNAFGVLGPRLAIYEAGSWLPISTPAAGVQNGSGTLPTLAIDTEDEPAMLVETLDSNQVETIQVEVLRAGSWTSLGSSLPTAIPSGTNAQAMLALGSDNTPFVLWAQPDATSSLSLHLARYTGTSWDTTYGTLNGMSQANTSAEYADLAIDKLGLPTVVWRETDPSTQMPSVYVWKSNY